MIKLRRLVKEFVEKALRGDSRPGFTACDAASNRSQDLVLTKSVQLGKVAAQPGLGDLIQHVQAESEGPGVQKLGNTCPSSALFGCEPEIDRPRNPEERFPVRLRNQAGANSRQRGHLMRIQELACGTAG